MSERVLGNIEMPVKILNYLYPQRNEFREVINLNGVWNFSVNNQEIPPDNLLPTIDFDRKIAVPGSWNEQFADLHNHLGLGWYEQKVFLNIDLSNKNIFLRLGAACNHNHLWINGKYVGKHRLGYLPAVFDITEYLIQGENIITICVDSLLNEDTLPTAAFDRGHHSGREMAADYFPYAGLHRDVVIFTTSKNYLINFKTEYELQDKKAIILTKLWMSPNVDSAAIELLDGNDNLCVTEVPVKNGKAESRCMVENPELWSPENPYLYTLKITCSCNNRICDIYSQPIGIRTIKVTNDSIMLNGKKIYLQGFSRHEDFPIIGRGHNDAVMVRDFEMMNWIGANSFRTSHYPYEEKQYQLADRLGKMIIDEASVVSLFFPKNGISPDEMVNDQLFELHKEIINAMLQRDWNHPSVIAWSMANECNGHTEKTCGYFEKIYKFTKNLDSTLPVIHTNIGDFYDNSNKWSDICCVNHYDFACEHKNRNMGEVKEFLRERLLKIHRKFNKPVLLSEFGICGIPGFHGISPQYFTEEGMVDHVFTYLDIADEFDFVVGTHIWLLNDFKAQECPTRPVNNFKGMFDRQRQPKLIAHLLKKRWCVNSDI